MSESARDSHAWERGPEDEPARCAWCGDECNEGEYYCSTLCGIYAERDSDDENPFEWER